ncbi:DUF1365 domain-containing protein [Alloalcanivorax mobilis]|uniref:DUF1365 domain-containing protein n=1 Tax=Alloalcanivorax mobilis TaxID=2019569 RepID=UPI000B5B3C19|nr:DUF1365 domain-containing protein [Alloalcanivorax mobilis]ASK34618.1 DUF1365 domain-containing protein [Alcanivorax sp. N3-2A]|tara:strand:+ start:4862 stop:5632 length:771 start_codon:yes stop_codon:yes gene_type:complete
MTERFALARGRVWHRRWRPEHRFQVPLWLVWCDVDAPEKLLARHRLWGRRWRPVVFRDRDFVDTSDDALGTKVRELAARHGLDWRHGDVFMLGQWRTFGFLFNPLVLYFYYPEGADRPASVIAEVRNTPWRERHFYVFELREDGETLRADHDKNFHVSPFLPMALRYHWTLHAVFPELRLTLQDKDGEQTVFAAGLEMTMVRAERSAMAAVIRHFGAQSLKTVAGIYWQAWKLWRKGAKLHAHPGRGKQRDEERRP